MAKMAADDEPGGSAATPGTAATRRTDPDRARGMMMGRNDERTPREPESVVRAPTMVMAEAAISVAETGRRGRRRVRVRGRTRREAREDGANDAMDDGMDARGEKRNSCTNAGQVASANERRVSATPFSAEDGGVPPGGRSAGQSAPRPRGRVVRSLLEEFNAAERGWRECSRREVITRHSRMSIWPTLIPSTNPTRRDNAEENVRQYLVTTRNL